MIKSIMSILIGTGGAQLLVFLCMPILSRIYTQESFGVFGYLGAIAAILSIIATLQLQHAIILPKVRKHASSLASVITVGSIFVGMLTAIFLVGLSYAGILPFKISWLDALLAGVLVFLLGHGQSLASLVVRENKFKHIGKAALIRALAMIFAQLAFYDIHINGLLLGQVVAEFISTVYMHKVTGHGFTHGASISQVLVNIRRNMDFAVNGTSQELINSISQGLPLLILGYFYGQLAVGAYAFAAKVMLAPAQLVSNSIRHVYTARFAEKIKKKESLSREYWRGVYVVLFPGLLVGMLIMPAMEFLFTRIFGESWAMSGNMAPWLLLWVVMLSANAPASVIMRLLKKQKESLVLNVQIILFRALALIGSGLLFESAVHAIAVFSVVGMILNFIYIGIAGKYANEFSK